MVHPLTTSSLCALMLRRTVQFSRVGRVTFTTPSTIQKQLRNQAPSTALLSDTCATESENGSRPHFLTAQALSLIHISEPTRRTPISYAVFCLKKKKTI